MDLRSVICPVPERISLLEIVDGFIITYFVQFEREFRCW